MGRECWERIWRVKIPVVDEGFDYGLRRPCVGVGRGGFVGETGEFEFLAGEVEMFGRDLRGLDN